jgi:hypothetical protein
VPRDREGTFAPRLIAKPERRFTGFDDKILALYARGMTVREIQGFRAAAPNDPQDARPLPARRRRHEIALAGAPEHHREMGAHGVLSLDEGGFSPSSA